MRAAQVIDSRLLLEQMTDYRVTTGKEMAPMNTFFPRDWDL